MEKIAAHRGAVVFDAVPSWGTSSVIAACSEGARPLVWIELEPGDAGSPILQGNKLAEALLRALGSPLLGYGLPYSDGLKVLERRSELLGPFTFALSGAQHGLELARDLLALERSGNRVILAFDALPGGFILPEHVLLLDDDALRLTAEEAAELVGGRLPPERVRALLKQAGGAYEPFCVQLNAALGLSPPLRPTPDGPQPLPGGAADASPEGFLALLLASERYLEALELAARSFARRLLELAEEFSNREELSATPSFALVVGLYPVGKPPVDQEGQE